MPGRTPNIPDIPHVHIQAQCGACHDPFQEGEKIIALTCHGHVIKFYDAQKYTSHGYCEQGNWLDVKFCRYPSCSYCLAQPETATIHNDCFQLFSQRCPVPDKWHRLWRAAISMHPWRHSDHLYLTRRRQAGDLLLLSKQLHLPIIERLFPELIEITASFIGPSLLWRYLTVIKLATSLQIAPILKPRILRLCDIQYWHRYQEPTLRHEPVTDSQYIRITIDSGGIEEISAVDASYETAPASSQLFIVEKPSTLGGVVARLQAGYCRLDFVHPTLITLLNCRLVPEAYRGIVQASTKRRAPSEQPKARIIQPYGHLSFINTALGFGLTFFLHSTGILAVHSHTPLAPTAYETFLRIPSGSRKSAVWVYLPLPIGDDIIALGGSANTRDNNAPQSGNLYVKTKRQGLIQLGRFEDGLTSVNLTKTARRPLLAHDVASGLIFLLGENLGVVSHYLPLKTSLFYGAYAAQAPLESITVAHKFMDSRTKHCRGLLFEYNDGRTRTVGQCRLGVDSVKSVQHPVRVCYMDMQNILAVEFTASNVHSHTPKTPDVKWTCHEMRGTLEFWFHQSTAKVRIV